ncbi:bZIP_1 domain-containing protein [Cephalotus follicularis]|uniref:BZIP_1 domain-containing protein n=1 Tax=Cephalotus follicularis TaxID=3775 RepID=A0A1Q3AVW8_CEPFO|nr:bZIP_1 domain-containing protein [Cephalotus follicularis]
MASSKLMTRKVDLSRRASSSSSSTKTDQYQTKNKNKNNKINDIFASTMTVDGILRKPYNSSNPPSESTLLDAQITLIETPMASDHVGNASNSAKTVEEVWREIVSGEKKEMKEELPDDMMTLEDFLAKAGAVDDQDVKMEEGPPPPMTELLSGGMYAFDAVPQSSYQVMDNAAQQRQRRMIKNRESAARSRERKQAYQLELESLAVRLEEENELLMKEKAERAKERFKQLMEKVFPVEESRRPPRPLRRVHSMQ